MRHLLVALVLLASLRGADARPAAVAMSPRGVIVAAGGVIHLEGAWSVDGVRNPTAIEVSPDRVVVLDAIEDEAIVVDLESGRTRRIATAATPAAARFSGSDLYILARSANLLQRLGGADIPLAADPAFIREAGGRVYVYSRTPGLLQEVEGDLVVRQLRVAPFASDFEIDGTTAYLVHPGDARVRMIDLTLMQPAGELAVGAVPVDLDFDGGGSAITARILAVADPSAKRIWLFEGRQTLGRAVARGFLRGFLWLGLFNRSSSFPTGIDRVIVRGSQRIAYDSSSQTLYRFSAKSSSVIATGIGPSAFDVDEQGIAWWDGEPVRTLRK